MARILCRGRDGRADGGGILRVARVILNAHGGSNSAVAGSVLRGDFGAGWGAERHRFLGGAILRAGCHGKKWRLRLSRPRSRGSGRRFRQSMFGIWGETADVGGIGLLGGGAGGAGRSGDDDDYQLFKLSGVLCEVKPRQTPNVPAKTCRPGLPS